MARWITRDKSYYRSILVLGLPIALQSLITFLVSFADNLMVGALGDTAVSGVYMGTQMQNLLQMVSGGAEGSILVLSAQYWGKNDTESIKKIVSIGIHFNLIFSTVMTIVCLLIPYPILRIFTTDPEVVEAGAQYLRIVCVSYIFFSVTQVLISSMRSVEVANIGMYVTLISLFVNVGLNYVLIFGKLGFPRMGVAGAALATTISRLVEMVVMIFYVRKVDKRLNLRPADLLKSDPVLRKDFIKTGIPLLGGNLVWSINLMASAAILGRYQAAVTTAVSIANTMNSLAFVTISGMSMAVSIITGKTVGAGKYELMKEYARTTQILFLLVGIVTGGVVYLLRDPFIHLYTGISAEAIHYARQFINVLCITMIGTCYQACCLGGLVKAGGDVSFVFKNDTVFIFLVVLPSAIITQRLGMEPWIVWVCLKSDQILKCIPAVVKINRFNWMKNLTRDKDREVAEAEGGK